MSSELSKLPEPFGYVSDWFGAPDGLMRFSHTPFPELHNLTHSVCSVFSVPQVLDVQQQAYTAGKAARIAELEADYQRLMDKHNALHINAQEARTERDTLRAEVERLTLSAARYEALRARHAYLIVSRLMGRESFSSETSRAQIDGFADKARAEVDAFNALTPEQRMNELQAHVDTARKATP